MRLAARLVALALSGLAVPAVADLATGPPAPFTLAVVRRDGVIIPFATYAGRTWKAHWPRPGRQGDVPLTVADVPRGWWGPVAPSAPWDLWPTGGSRQPLTIVGTTIFYPHCQSNVGLRSDFRTEEPIPPATQHHHPKDGVAIAGGSVPVEPIEVLPESAPEWAALSDKMSRHVSVAEESALGPAGQTPGNARGATRAIVAQTLRMATPLTPEVICRSPGRTPGSTIYYVEGVKDYGATITRLGLRTSVSPRVFFWGYVHLGTDGVADTFIQAVATRSASNTQRAPGVTQNAAAITYTTPLAMLRVEGVPLWVVQRAGFGWEEYAVLDLSKPRPVVLISTFGGGC